MKKRGVSPVIATLLLIVIAVAAAVLAYIWITGYQGTLTQQASTTQLQERIAIEAVSYNGTTLTAYVRNVGDVKVNITTIYVFNGSGTIINSNNNNYQLATPVVISPGQVSTVTTSVTLTAGNTYTVEVVTKYGTKASYVFTYRG
ncbi:archaellin/type IV pilin N-terminal domain-containing protein [Thermofilum pendens]|uniref:Flagellin n=1 Tax=Thermofilum pendens (strain DSM 2475 / Hrk 5) TaxID=368408 RepID=A1RZI2_THEPD|nr:archaellin/type IV pilin N-terminal domain-containing protein [Thermofilum pendens]ABL78612.1 conserved hypothetical protein [Thermofilum pendens Hrk 5]